MGIIAKIEDKLSGSSKHEDQNKLSKSSSEPEVGSSNYDNNDYGGNNHDSNNYDNSMNASGHVSRDGYGSPTNTTSGGRPSTDRRYDNAEDGEKSSYNRVPRKPYDPFSRKGQQTAADAARPTSKEGYGRSSHDEPSVSRSKHGGITNQADDSRYPSDSRQTPGSYPDDSTESQHHYGRDAAAAGGLGAAGVGAYELGKNRDNKSNSHSRDPSRTGQQSSYPKSKGSSPQESSYNSRSPGGQQYGQGERHSYDDPAIVGGAGKGSNGGSQIMSSASIAKKMGGKSSYPFRPCVMFPRLRLKRRLWKLC